MPEEKTVVNATVEEGVIMFGKVPLVEAMARVAYDANRAYCQLIGDNSFKSWDEAPEWQKETNIEGVKFKIANPDATPEQLHNSWLLKKREDGWKYGLLKDEEKKEHPCIVEYNMLPGKQKIKDMLFAAVITAFEDGLKVGV